MRILVVSVLLLGTAACAAPPDPREVLAPAINAVNAVFAMLPPPPPPLSETPPPPLPGRLTLSNFTFPRARVEAMITPYPDCEPRQGLAITNFELPLNGTHVIDTPAGSDVCWRRLEPPLSETPSPRELPPTAWNRAFLSSGRIVDSRL